MSEDFDNFRQTDRFRVTLDGIKAGDFREVKGLEVKIPVEEFAEGGLNDHAHKLPGQARYSTILLRRGSSDSLELFDWIQNAMRGDLEFRSGSIMALNKRDEPVMVWEFRKAWPCRYEGSSFDRARPELHIETLELGHHGFTLRRGGAGSLAGPKPSSPAQAKPTPPVKTGVPLDDAVNFAVWRVPGLEEPQARVLISEAFKRDSSVVLGGSRIRGNHKPDSDLDAGYGSLSTSQAGKVNKKAEAAGDLSMEKTKIVPGNSTENIEEIQSPEEFFMRSGVRKEPDPRAPEPYEPSGYVSLEPDGSITEVSPSGEAKGY